MSFPSSLERVDWASVIAMVDEQVEAEQAHERALLKAERAGMRANRDGRRLLDNPYPLASAESFEWRSGWQAVRRKRSK